jgi:hypothetical protein
MHVCFLNHQQLISSNRDPKRTIDWLAESIQEDRRKINIMMVESNQLMAPLGLNAMK